MVDTAENFHLNIPQEPVYWPETPTSEGLGSPIASFTQNPNATTCVTGSTTCENEVALKGVPMSDTNPGNMDRTTQVSVSPQIASPRTVRTTERSMSTDNSRQAGKRTKDKRPPRIGLRYIITVMCGDKQQVYCQLCSVRLNHSTHLSSLEHQRKYIIKRFPNWNATSVDENELAKMVNKLADMDKCLSDQKVKVGFDTYQNLAVLPEGKAILALREILSAQRKQNPSLAPRLDDVSSPRSHSSKDSAQKTPGHSTSAQSSTREDQKSGNGKPLKAGCTMGSSSQNLLKDIQKSSEKALPGFSSKHKELSRNDHCSLQSSRKHQNTTSVEDKPLEAPMTSTGCSSTNQFLMKDNHEGPPSGSYTVHWELHEADLGDSIHTANQSTVNGHTPGENILFLQPHQNEQQMPEHGLGSVGTSEVGEKDLCSILKKNDVEPVIGLALIWVCQVSPESTDPAAVYLCESCSKKMMISELCQHLVSVEHQINYLRRGYPHLVYFWFLEDLHQWMKENILEDVVRTLAVREQHFKKRAQSVCLSQVLYNMVKEGSFCNALKIAQHCKKNVSM